MPIQKFPLNISIFFSLSLVFCLVNSEVRAAQPQPATYHVRRGDYLSSIAQRFGTTVKLLKKDNALTGDLINIGQALKISRPFRDQKQTLVWQKVVRNPGRVLRPYGQYKAGGIIMPRTGVEIAGATGTRLYNPATGIVRHSGPMDGFGHLLIIEHPGRYATVIAPCDPASLEVKVGQAILAGDLLGLTGLPPAPNSKPYIHLELRRHDKTIAPDRLIK